MGDMERVTPGISSISWRITQSAYSISTMDTGSSQYETAYLQALAATLRAERAAADLTFEELAELSGVSKSSLLRFEKGTRDPSIGTLTKIAQALGKTPVYLAVHAESRLANPSLPDAVIPPDQVARIDQLSAQRRDRDASRTPNTKRSKRKGDA